MILKLDLKIDTKGIEKELERLKEWYNNHWFSSYDVLKQNAKDIVLRYIDVDIVDNVEKK